MRTRRGAAGRGAVLAVVALAAMAVAGCGTAPSGPRRAAVSACARDSASALRRHAALTALPAPCRGLGRAGLRLAAAAAVREVAGTMRGKTLMRARRRALRPLLPGLSVMPPQQRRVVTGPAGGLPAGPPAGPAALVCWLATAALGLAIMAEWAFRRRPRPARAGSHPGSHPGSRPGSQPGPRPVMNYAHLGLALAGLAAWACYLATGVRALAWAACAALLPVTGLGMSLLILRLPGGSRLPQGGPAPVAVPVTAGAGTAPAGTAPGVAAVTAPAEGSGPDGEPAAAGTGLPRARHLPALAVAAHVTLAVVTVLLTLLAAVGPG